MANKKHHKKRVSDAKTIKSKLPPRPPILHMTLDYPKYFPLTIPVTMSTLCCLPPGAAKLDFNDHCFNKITAVGVVCWNMKIEKQVEYYLYDPHDKSETFFHVVQCPIFGDKNPHCYPMGTYVGVTGHIVGTTKTTLVMGNVMPITERVYNEFVFQARMAKFQCALDVVPKPLLRDADLFKVTTNYTFEQVRMEITAKILAQYHAGVVARPVKFTEPSDSVFNYFVLCGQQSRKLASSLQNRHSAEPNGTPKIADGNETASQNHSILKNANATVFSVPYKHNKARKAYTSNIDDYTKLVDYFLDVDIMKLKLAVCFYDNHAPVTVDMLNALPEKDKFKWGGLTFKTVRVMGKVVSKTIEVKEIHYVLEDLQTSARYSVLQYISEDTGMTAMTFDKGDFVEVVGDLHARTKKRNHDAVIADNVRGIEKKCPFIQRFIDNAAYVREYDNETIQIVLLAMSFTDYWRCGTPLSKFPVSATCDIIEMCDLCEVIPVVYSNGLNEVY